MKLYEKFKTMTLEEMAGELLLVATWDKNEVEKASKGDDGLLGFVIRVLEQEVDNEDELSVYDVSAHEDGFRGDFITIAYECGDIGDGEYSLAFSEKKYDEKTDSFQREILAFSDGMDTETDKSFLYRLLNDIADRAIVVD